MQRAIAKGKRQIVELQDTISTLEETVEGLSGEVEGQKRGAERLREALESTRGLLESAVVEYRKELARQAEVIKKQQSVMGDVYQNKLNQDFIVDSTLFVFCLWLVNTFAVEYPLQGFLQMAVKGERRKMWAKQAGKTALLFLVMRRLRIGAVRYGVHHRVGSFVPYASSAFGVVMSTFARALGMSRAATSVTA
ncbi:hypothetical protein HDU67_002089, partial [Dinochytrium kinnereticum]